MSTRTAPWPAGTPCWADLMAPDVEAAGRFYSAVLGWEVPAPDEQHGGYVVAHVGGAACAGIGPDREGARTAWTLYFGTDDAEATVAAIPEHGGTVMSPVADVMELGRMALGVDPSGAVFGLWQAGTFNGSQLVMEPGCLAWEDLRSTDPAGATAFYGALLGLEVTPLEMAGPDYGTFTTESASDPCGGIGGLMGGDGPSQWLVYFAVTATDAAVDAAEQTGGTVVAPAFDTPFGRMAGLRDPSGALFWVVQAMGEQPDRTG